MANLKNSAGPTWGKASPTRTTGVGRSDRELAARLNPAMANQLVGDVFFHEDFEAGVLHWGYLTTVTSRVPILTARRAYQGRQSVLLYPASGVTDSLGLLRAFTVPMRPRLGLSFFWAVEEWEGILTASMDGQVDDVPTTFTIQANLDTGAVSVYKAPGVYEQVGSFTPSSYDGNHWQYFQLVGDFVQQQYVRLWFGSNLFELNQAAPSGTIRVFDDFVQVRLIAYPNGASVPQWYIDDLILSRNEL